MDNAYIRPIYLNVKPASKRSRTIYAVKETCLFLLEAIIVLLVLFGVIYASILSFDKQFPQKPQQHTTYTVAPGDTLFGIARTQLPDIPRVTAMGWLKEDNPQARGEYIHPGDVLQVPVVEAVVVGTDKSQPRDTYTASRGVTYEEMTLEITAYSMGETMFSGLPVDRGALAVDPRTIPLGSIVWVPDGVGYVVALDTGGDIKGAKADLYMPDKGKAVKWGRKQVTVRVVKVE